MWSRKSAMLGSLAVAMYLLGLTLRNSQLVTIAVVIFVILATASASSFRLTKKLEDVYG